MDARITKQRVGVHLEYDWFKYIIIALVAVFAWISVYSTVDQPAESEILAFFSISEQWNANSAKAVNEDMLEQFGTAALGGREDGKIREVNVRSHLEGAEGLNELLQTSVLEADFVIARADRFKTLVETGYFLDINKLVSDGYFTREFIDGQTLFVYEYTPSEEYDNGEFGQIDGLCYGLRLPQNMFFMHNGYKEKEDGSGTETFYEEYYIGIVGTGLPGGCGGGNSGGGNRGKYNSSEHTEDIQAFEAIKYIFENQSRYIAKAG
ncbi:MAG: hypothetical protein LBS99_04005 [Clostridiales bacterium]|jgi:hypothetical protein|nr:hypothetical protein [Clostridiales bacterium]